MTIMWSSGFDVHVASRWPFDLVLVRFRFVRFLLANASHAEVVFFFVVVRVWHVFHCFKVLAECR